METGKVMAENQPDKHAHKLTPKMQELKWKPGQSGNPKGRPKKEMSITDALRRIGEEVNPQTKQTKIQILAEMIWETALKGDKIMAQMIIERLEGKPRQPIEIDKPEPITIIKDEW